jgi:ubiquinone/menaquinone biosynthesis C-methylase UbiE
MKFLDVAAGSGALAIPAARLGAQVFSVDISPAMIERLKARARQEGVSNVEAHVMDGHALEFKDNTFDLSGSQFGVMLFPDLPRALREMVRVTNPGGRVFLVNFGPLAKVEFFSFFIRAIRAAVPSFTGTPPEPPPLPFQIADPKKLRSALADAELKEIRVEGAIEQLVFQSGENMWEWLVNSNPIAEAILSGLHLTEEQRGVIVQALDDMVRARAGGNGPALLTAQVYIGIGTK